MLVIRRRVGEAVLIGEGVEITVIDVSASRVKLGIEAPSTVPILRKEIQLAAQQNLAAAQGATPASVGMLLAALRQAAGRGREAGNTGAAGQATAGSSGVIAR
jgi:carbon storage regulator